MHLDINCDTGEGTGNDEALMPFITSANVACGYHAGDEETMRATIQLALRHGVQVGAHPSFADRENFGRAEMQLSPNEAYHLVYKQLLLFKAVADDCGATLHHVKPHGALYNLAASDVELASAVALAVKDFGSHLLLYALSGSHLVAEGKRLGLQARHEVFADRRYRDDGSLVPRTQPDALIEDTPTAVAQVLQLVAGRVVTASGKTIPLHADTVCVHGDGKNAVALAQAIHAALRPEHKTGASLS